MGNCNSSNLTPCQSKTLRTLTKEQKSAETESESEMKLEQIQQNYSNLIINSVKIALRPVEKLARIANVIEKDLLQSVPRSSLNIDHWEILITFHDINYWLICFSQQGLTNLIGMNYEQVLTWKGRFPNNKIESWIKVRSNVKVADVVSAIKEVRDKKYHALAWNCQCFTAHVVNKIKQ